MKAKYIFMLLPAPLVLIILLLQHQQVEELKEQAEHLQQQTVELNTQVLELKQGMEEDSKLLEGCVMHMDTSLVDEENAEIAKRDGGTWTDNDTFGLIQQRKRDGGSHG